MTKSRLLQAIGLLVLGGGLAAVALVTLTVRSHLTASQAASPAVVAPAGAAAHSGQAVQGPNATPTSQVTAPPVQRVITAGPLAPGQAQVQAPANQAGTTGGGVLPDPHGPPSIKPIASVAPPFADSIDGGSPGLAPLNRPPAGALGAGICSTPKNCR